MTRYFGLVLVPADTPEADIYNVAADLLFPHQRNDNEPEREYEFDWFLQPDDITDDEEQLEDYVWNVPEIIERFPELEIETILTPDGRWHHSELGLWDDEEWVQEARAVLQKHVDCLALKHLFHV